MTSKSPLLTLNNGVQMPAVGLGVFQSSPEPDPDTITLETFKREIPEA